MTDNPRTRPSRRLQIGAAAAVAVTLGVTTAILLSGTDPASVAASPTPSSVAFASPAPSSSSVGSPSVQPTQPPGSSLRATGPPGAANDAVLVRMLGGVLGRPDEIEVSLVTLDAGAYETNLQPRVIARIAGSMIPAGVELLPGGVKYGQEGWLAVEGGLAAEPFGGRVVIFDLRAPEAEPWLVPGEPGGSAWGPGSVLAVADEGEIRLNDASGRTSRTIEVPAGIVVSSADSPMYFPPTWLADGSGFATWEAGDVGAFGRLGLDGSLTPTDDPPAIFQSTGRERRWAPDGSELTVECAQDAGQESCRVSATHSGSPPAVWWTAGSGGGVVQDFVWDAMGGGVWLLTERVTGEGPVTYALSHADAPNDWTDVTVTALDQPSEGGFVIHGVSDAATTADGRNVLIGPQASTVHLAVSGDGARASLAGDAWFAGWAADLGPYPAR
jgi:hypothetical protein